MDLRVLFFWVFVAGVVAFFVLAATMYWQLKHIPYNEPITVRWYQVFLLSVGFLLTIGSGICTAIV